MGARKHRYRWWNPTREATDFNADLSATHLDRLWLSYCFISTGTLVSERPLERCRSETPSKRCSLAPFEHLLLEEEPQSLRFRSKFCCSLLRRESDSATTVKGGTLSLIQVGWVVYLFCSASRYATDDLIVFTSSIVCVSICLTFFSTSFCRC